MNDKSLNFVVDNLPYFGLLIFTIVLLTLFFGISYAEKKLDQELKVEAMKNGYIQVADPRSTYQTLWIKQENK